MTHYTGPERRDQSPRGKAVREAVSGLLADLSFRLSQREHLGLALRNAYDAGSAQERKRVVEELRSMDAETVIERIARDRWADAIERGDHEAKP